MRNGRFAYAMLLLAVGSLAQQPAAHISGVRGDVSVFRAAGEKIKGRKNMLLAAGDHITSGRFSRADLQLDFAVRLRVDDMSEMRVAQMDRDGIRMELARGGVTCYVGNAPAGEIRIDGPSVSARLSQQGEYRISISKAGESELLARKGELEVFSPAGSQPVAAGQKMIARGDRSNPEFRIVDGTSRWARAVAAIGGMVQVGVDAGSSSSTYDSDSGSNSNSGSSSSGGSSTPAKEQASQPASKPAAPVARTEDSVSRSSPRTGSVK